MSTLICSITGKIASSPVIAKNSGRIFERKVIETVIEHEAWGKYGLGAINKSDLVEVVINSKPVELSQTKLNEAVEGFQKGWDEILVENAELKLKLEEKKRDLTAALYKSDASVRVIAKLKQEISEYRAILTQVENDS